MKLNRKQFYNQFRPYYKKITGKALATSHVANLEFLLDSFEASEWFSADIRRIAYALATIHVETFIPKTGSRYAPVVEQGSRAYFNKYDKAYNPRKARELGNTEFGDGYLMRGRGYCQLTGRKNYTKFGIADNPDEALHPQKAFEILETGMRTGVWTGKSLNLYINSKTDYKGARRVVNGQDRAAEIAEYAVNFEHILRNSGEEIASPTTSPEPPQSETSTTSSPDTTVVEREPEPKGFWDGIKMKFTAFWATVGGTEGAKQFASDAQFLGLTADTWRLLTYIALGLGALLFIGYGIKWLWSQYIGPRLLTAALVQANNRPTNVVTVAESDRIAELEALGYTVARRK